MLKRYFFVKIYPVLFLIWKPLLIGFGAVLLFIWIGVQLGLFRDPILSADAIEAVPSTSTIILEVKKKEFREKLKSTAYFNELKGFAPIETWFNEFETIDSLFFNSKSYSPIFEKVKLTSAVVLEGSNNFVWLHIIELNGKKISVQKLAKEFSLELEDESNYLGSKIYEFRHSRFGRWTICQNRGLIILSRQTAQVEASIAAINNTGNNLPFDSRFREVKTSLKSGELNIYINLEMSSIFLSILGPNASLSSEPVLKNMAWAGGSIKFEKGNFVLGGKMTLKDSDGFMLWLSNQSPKKTVELGRFIPENFAFLYFLNTTNFEKYCRTLSKEQQNMDFNKYILPWLGNEAAFFITEPTSQDMNADKFVILHSKDIVLTRKLMQEYANHFGILDSRKIKNQQLTQIAGNDLMNTLFGKSLSVLQKPYFTIIDNYVVFCNSSSVLELWLENYQAGKTIEKSVEFKAFAGQLRQPSGTYFLINTPNAAQLIKHFSAPEIERLLDARLIKLQSIWPIGIQLEGLGNGNFSLTVTAAYNPRSNTNVKSNIAWRCKLKSDAAIQPSIVKNIESGEYEILVQDKDNRLYLINRSGEILWEKPIDSRILSEIKQVDYYGNSKLYYAFNSEKSIYVMDIKGETIKKIPLVDKASNAMTSFIYNDVLRFYVGSKRGKVYGYDKNGRPLPGWNPNSYIGNIQFPMQYYQLSEDKEFMISMNRNGKIHLSSRNGEPIKSYFFDGYYLSGFYIDEIGKRIVLGSTNGKIHVVNFQGKKFDIAPNKGMEKEVYFVLADVLGDERPDYIRQSKKLLTVHSLDKKDKLTESLRFQYDFPQDEIFALKFSNSDKAYIGSFDATRSEINIIDPNGKKLLGFPMQGNGKFLVADLFHDNGNTIIFCKGNQVMAAKLK